MDHTSSYTQSPQDLASLSPSFFSIIPPTEYLTFSTSNFSVRDYVDDHFVVGQMDPQHLGNVLGALQLQLQQLSLSVRGAQSFLLQWQSQNLPSTHDKVHESSVSDPYQETSLDDAELCTVKPGDSISVRDLHQAEDVPDLIDLGVELDQGQPKAKVPFEKAAAPVTKILMLGDLLEFDREELEEGQKRTADLSPPVNRPELSNFTFFFQDQSEKSLDSCDPKQEAPTTSGLKPASFSRWTLDEIYGSQRECDYAEAEQRRGLYDTRRSTLGYFRFGITFVPERNDTSCFRKVVIGGLLTNVKLDDVVDRIRGGSLESICLLDTTFMNGTMTAMVTFIHGESAARYVSFVEKHGLPGFGFPLIKLVSTPTYPLPYRVLRALSTQNCSRCLSIPDWPQGLSVANITSLEDLLSNFFVESVQIVDDSLRIRFGSIQMSLDFKELIDGYGYRLRSGHYADPTSLPLSTLADLDTDTKLEQPGLGLLSNRNLTAVNSYDKAAAGEFPSKVVGNHRRNLNGFDSSLNGD